MIEAGLCRGVAQFIASSKRWSIFWWNSTVFISMWNQASGYV